MWKSYFATRSFPLAFVQFGLFHIKRVSEQRLGFGFKLYRPIPHGEQVQRFALCVRAFPTLPKQAQVTMASAEGCGKQTHTSETGSRKGAPRCPEAECSQAIHF